MGSQAHHMDDARPATLQMQHTRMDAVPFVSRLSPLDRLGHPFIAAANFYWENTWGLLAKLWDDEPVDKHR